MGQRGRGRGKKKEEEEEEEERKRGRILRDLEGRSEVHLGEHLGEKRKFAKLLRLATLHLSISKSTGIPSPPLLRFQVRSRTVTCLCSSSPRFSRRCWIFWWTFDGWNQFSSARRGWNEGRDQKSREESFVNDEIFFEIFPVQERRTKYI